MKSDDDDDTDLPVHSTVILWINFAHVNALETGFINCNGLILLSLQWSLPVLNHPAPTKILRSAPLNVPLHELPCFRFYY